MKRILTTLTLGIGLTAGTVFAASAAPSQIITPSATTAGGGSGSSGRSSRNSVASSSAGTWVKDAKGWWLNYGPGNYAKNTWVNKDSKWYYFDVEGYMLTSWRFINNNWYYLHDDGHMNTGWLLTENTRKWYYFDSTGAMWYNATTPDGYYVDNNGVFVER